MFIFLVDPDNPIELAGGEQVYRGFYTWNSEVGASVFGLTTFLYRYVCDNRIIWGVSNVKELKIRHTGGAPERFAYEGERYLAQYAEESSVGVADTIQRAQSYELDRQENQDGGWESWLKKRGFTGAMAKEAVRTASAEEGGARSLWDIVNGVTASARKVTHTNERVKLEQQAGDLLKVVVGS